MTSPYPDRAAHDHFMTIFRTRTAQLGTRNGGKRKQSHDHFLNMSRPYQRIILHDQDNLAASLRDFRFARFHSFFGFLAVAGQADLEAGPSARIAFSVSIRLLQFD